MPSRKYNKAPDINFQADDVWAAACAAQRVNDSYIKVKIDEFSGIKSTTDETDVKTVKTNRELMMEFLSDTSKITEDDRKQGEVVRTYFKGFTFKILQGIKLNEFFNTAMIIANRDNIYSMYDIAVIASLPQSHERSVKRDQQNRKLENASGFVGQIGEKLTLKMQVVKTVYSNNFNVFFISGVTEENNAVFFSYRNNIDIGTIIQVQGTVKSHRKERNEFTQLNRAKVLTI